MALWDNNYSNTPLRGDERKYGAKHLRELKLGLVKEESLSIILRLELGLSTKLACVLYYL